MNYRAYIGLALLLVVVIFIVQNATLVESRLLFRESSMSRSLIIFFVLATGIVVGWLNAGNFHKRRQQIPQG